MKQTKKTTGLELVVILKTDQELGCFTRAENLRMVDIKINA